VECLKGELVFAFGELQRSCAAELEAAAAQQQALDA